MTKGIPVVLLILVYVAIATEVENVYTSNSWTPISKEVILNRILNNERPRKNNEHIRQNVWDETERDMQVLRDQAIKVIIPEIYQIKQKIGEAHTYSPNDNISFINDSAETSIRCEDSSCNTNLTKYIQPRTAEGNLKFLKVPENHLRTSKAIKTHVKDATKITLDEPNSIHEEHKIDSSKTMAVKEEENKQESQTYEVIEDTKNFDTTVGERYIKNSDRHFHRPALSHINNLQQINITGVFFDILNGYNIRPQDHLPNYDLSRLNKGRNVIKENYVHVPIPLRIPHRYNSQNHLAVDPLIALFLSNYGYYIPGMYGQNVNYRNLYGYLASNNMHNNLPFGFYKIFADTDSSN